MAALDSKTAKHDKRWLKFAVLSASSHSGKASELYTQRTSFSESSLDQVGIEPDLYPSFHLPRHGLSLVRLQALVLLAWTCWTGACNAGAGSRRIQSEAQKTTGPSAHLQLWRPSLSSRHLGRPHSNTAVGEQCFCSSAAAALSMVRRRTCMLLLPERATIPLCCGLKVFFSTKLLRRVSGQAGKSWRSSLLFMVAGAVCLSLLLSRSRGDLAPPHSLVDVAHRATIAENTAATASEPQPDAALPMDITVRVEVQYHAPANAVTRDVLEMFRSTTWVRFMMRYVSPRLKSSSPADQAILDELESQEAAEVHEGEECVICMSENPCDGHVALPCGHSFHYPCISSWLQNQSTCPVCRFQFPKAFTGKYAVQKLKSSMVLSEEQGKMPRAELLALDIGKQVVRAVVSVTLVKVAAEGDDEEFPCELSAWMLDPTTGETFSELDCI